MHSPETAITPPDTTRFGVLSHAPFRRYFSARTCSAFARQIGAISVGWQIYALTHSAYALGMIGLCGFLPTLILLFLGGHAADKFDRRRVLQACQMLNALVAAMIAWGSFAGWITAPMLFAAVIILGCSSAFENPAGSAMLSAVAPEGQLSKAAALSTSAFHLASITGPALGGFAFGISNGLPYAMMSGAWIAASFLNAGIHVRARLVDPKGRPSVFAGLHFVMEKPALLGTMSLDLVAVLLGGATALLPIYAKDILHTGPWGLGFLRGAPAAGGLIMTAILAKTGLKKKAGLRMLQAVMVFGVFTIVFALSKVLWLSLVALAVMGAADLISMVTRTSLVQLWTPDSMRGRVAAVNSLFINASNQLGEFESGITAGLMGPVAAAAVGGVATILVALAWFKLFPAVARIDTLEETKV